MTDSNTPSVPNGGTESLDAMRERIGRGLRNPRYWCGCDKRCGDDGDIDGPGTCRGLPREPDPPLVEIVMVPK